MNAERDAEIIRLRQQELLTLAAIGNRYEITRERVRQILKMADIDGCLSKPQQWPIPRFRKRMMAALRENGWRYCARCKTFKCRLLEFFPKATTYCRKCSVDRCLDCYHKNPRIRESMNRWQRENRDKTREYHKKWRLKKRTHGDSGESVRTEK